MYFFMSLPAIFKQIVKKKKKKRITTSNVHNFNREKFIDYDNSDYSWKQSKEKKN